MNKYKLSYEIENNSKGTFTLIRHYHFVNGNTLEKWAKQESCGRFDTVQDALNRVDYFNSVIDWAGIA